jgi:hypothetical protein
MTQVDCPRTTQVLGAPGTAVTADHTAYAADATATADHVATCPTCAAALVADRALSDFAAALERQAAPPTATQILFRAQQRQIALAADRAVRPIKLWGLCVAVGCILAAAFLLVAHAGALWHRVLSLQAAAAPPLLILAGVVSVGLASLLLHLHGAWTEP